MVAEKLGSIDYDNTRRMAIHDRNKLANKKIKSPDVTKMHKVTYGNTSYYFRKRSRMEKFIKDNRHYEILGVKIHVDDQAKPSIDEKFEFLNKKDNNGS